MVQDVNPPKVSLAEKPMDRRKFLYVFGAGGAAAAVEMKYKPFRNLWGYLFNSDSEPDKGYTGEMDSAVLDCGSDPGGAVHYASKELVELFSRDEKKLKASGEWNSDYIKQSYWERVLADKNPDGLKSHNEKCSFKVPKAYKSEIEKTLNR